MVVTAKKCLVGKSTLYTLLQHKSSHATTVFVLTHQGTLGTWRYHMHIIVEVTYLLGESQEIWSTVILVGCFLPSS